MINPITNCSNINCIIFILVKVFGGGVYLKNSPKLETGITLSTSADGASSFGIGCKYTLGPDASLRAKVDNGTQVMVNVHNLNLLITI